MAAYAISVPTLICCRASRAPTGRRAHARLAIESDRQGLSVFSNVGRITAVIGHGG
jgi:hypothetical protein